MLNSTYEGFNETVGETAEGQLVRLQNAFEDTKVKIGEALLPELLLLLEAFRENVLPEIEKFTDFIIEETIPAIKEYLTPQIERLVGTMLGLVEAFDETTRAVVPTRDGVNFLTAYVQEVALAVWEGFLNVINGIGVALTELTRILGFFAVLFTQFDLDKAIEVLNFEQYRLNNTVGDAQREFLKYQQQLDTTTNSLASAYRELRFYNNFKKEIALPTTKTETELLQEQIETLKAQLAAANAAGEGAKKFAAAQADKKKSVDDTSLSLKMQLAILRDIGGASFAAAGGANIRSGATLQESVRSSADIVSQFGGFIGGFNLNPSDPFFGFGQGSDIGTFKRGSGGTVNINVNGTVIDPEGAARAISDLLVRGSGRAGDLPIFTPLGAS